jgi:hypothetical protein
MPPNSRDKHLPTGNHAADKGRLIKPVIRKLHLDALQSLAHDLYYSDFVPKKTRQKLCKRWELGPDPRPFRAERFSPPMQHIVDVLAVVKYAGSVLSTRHLTHDAYVCLIETIAALSPPPPSDEAAAAQDRPGGMKARHRKPVASPVTADGTESETGGSAEGNRGPRQERDHAVARHAIERFCEAIGCDLFTAYSRDGRLNRVKVLHLHEDTYYPEAMQGFVWREDIPTRFLYSKEGTIFVPPLPDAGDSGMKGRYGFQHRESIDPARVIAIRMIWEQSRFVVFLNWRKRNATQTRKLLERKPHLRAIFKELNEAHASRSSGEKIPTLMLAVRYLTGWLALSGIDLSEGRELLSKKFDASMTINKTILAGKEYKESDHAGELTSIVRDVCGFESNSSVRRITDDGQVDFSNRSLASPENYPIEPRGPDHILVERSICAQAALWGLPLLIHDLDKPLPAPQPGGRVETWRDIHVATSSFQCQSEIAVPVGQKGTPRCVINVEAKTVGALRPEHVHRIELIAHLFDKVLAIEHPKHAEFVSTLNEHLASAQSLLKGLMNWFHRELKTDLAYALIYDPRVRVFRPMGITISQPNARRFLTNPLESPNIALQAAADTNPLVVALIEHAIANRLLPSRRGKSWDVYRESKLSLTVYKGRKARVRSGGENANPRKVDDLTAEKYAPIQLAVPLSHQPDARPDGVVWLTWLQEDVAENVAGAPVTDTVFETNVHNKIRPLIEVAAAAYAIYRYVDPDAATQSFPYGKPS